MKRNIVTSDTCVLCGMEREDTFHVFCRCTMARNLWEAMREVWPIPPVEDIKNTGSEWCLHALCQAPKHVRVMMMMTWWRIWYARNEVVHHKPAPPIEASRRFLCSYLESLLSLKQAPFVDPVKGKTAVTNDHMLLRTRKPMLKPKKQKDQNNWTKPTRGWLKLNVDGSWCEGENTGGIGMVLRNDEGEIIFSACRYLITCYSPLEAELSACVEGLSLAMQWSAGPIVLESDCLVATQMINDANFNRSHLAALVNEAKEFCRGSRECKVIHISREFNGVSHSLAKLSRLNLCTQFWNRSGPDEIRLACIQDNTMPP